MEEQSITSGAELTLEDRVKALEEAVFEEKDGEAEETENNETPENTEETE